jgi:hypothetical protein
MCFGVVWEIKVKKQKDLNAIYYCRKIINKCLIENYKQKYLRKNY